MQPIETSFSAMFGLRYPIVCAPMFLVSNTRMVIATAASGGLGAFPALNYRPVSRFAEAVQEIKAETAGPFGVNLIIQEDNKNLDAQLDVIIAQRVPLIITSLGNPARVIARAHAAGIKVFCDVINLYHARKVIVAGADGLIAVSSGAGGHGGNISSFALIPSLVSLTDRPVIAAGSIVDGRGMLAALALGAAGIYMGTRFIASEEAGVSAGYRDAILNATAEDIVTTKKVDGYPGNFIKTENLLRAGLEPGVLELLLERNKKLRKILAIYRARKVIFSSPSTDHMSYRNTYAAGQGVGLITKVESIADIIQSTVTEYHTLKGKLP